MLLENVKAPTVVTTSLELPLKPRLLQAALGELHQGGLAAADGRGGGVHGLTQKKTSQKGCQPLSGVAVAEALQNVH